MKLEDTPAKMAASSQVFDEARHFYVLRDYLWRAGLPVKKLGGWSRRLLVELLETESLLYKVVGMQLLVENTAVVMFRKIAETRIKGLFKMSRAAQDRFQELFFPSKPQPAVMRALRSAIVALGPAPRSLARAPRAGIGAGEASNGRRRSAARHAGRTRTGDES